MHIRPINPVRISQEKLKSKGEKKENAKGKTRHTCAPTVLAIFRTNSKDSRPSLSPALLPSLSWRPRQTHDQMSQSISIWRSN